MGLPFLSTEPSCPASPLRDTPQFPSPRGVIAEFHISDTSVISEPRNAKETEAFDGEHQPRPTSPTSVLDLSWDLVPALEPSQRSSLHRVANQGVSWVHPTTKQTVWLTLHHGGEVEADGNCLFSSIRQLLSPPWTGDNMDLRKMAVDQFLQEYQSGNGLFKTQIDQAVKNMYYPNLDYGWGLHYVQELKLLAKKSEREAMDTSIEELTGCGMAREMAAETVYKERCLTIDDGESWGKFMLISGRQEDEYDIISLQYAEDGLLIVEENREGKLAAFGDDFVIQCLASVFSREIFVMQSHGSDGMVDSSSNLFFLPHKPSGDVLHQPLFLFMKGTGWCGSGGDHYEPIICRHREKSGEKPFIQL